MLVALIIMTLLVGFFLGVIALGGVFSYLVRQNEMEKRLDIDLAKEVVFDDSEKMRAAQQRQTILSY